MTSQGHERSDIGSPAPRCASACQGRGLSLDELDQIVLGISVSAILHAVPVACSVPLKLRRCCKPMMIFHGKACLKMHQAEFRHNLMIKDIIHCCRMVSGATRLKKHSVRGGFLRLVCSEREPCSAAPVEISLDVVDRAQKK